MKPAIKCAFTRPQGLWYSMSGCSMRGVLVWSWAIGPESERAA